MYLVFNSTSSQVGFTAAVVPVNEFEKDDACCCCSINIEGLVSDKTVFLA
jgi:hypothetical protein